MFTPMSTLTTCFCELCVPDWGDVEADLQPELMAASGTESVTAILATPAARDGFSTRLGDGPARN